MKKRVAAVLLSICASLSALPVKHYSLSNGLNLYVKTDQRSPVVLSELWYRVASADERLGETGLSHLLEHMMFQGTTKYPKDNASQMIASKGGYDNAFTSRNATRYVIMMQKQYLPMILDIEADRMQHLIINQTKFKRERNVVMEERRMRIEDNPSSLAFEHLNEIANIASPYQAPVIGYQNDIDQLTKDQAISWYQQYYAPNNANLIIVGDVNPDKVYQLVKKNFATILAKPLKPMHTYPMSKPVGQTAINFNSNTKVPLLLMDFKVPALTSSSATSDAYALTMLAESLSGLKSSVLDQQLVRGQNLAQSVSISYSPIARYATTLTIMARPMPGVARAELEDAIWGVIDQFKSAPVNRALLSRIRTSLKAGFVYQQDSLRSQAYLMGSVVNAHLPISLTQSYLKHLLAVKPSQIQSVAGQYLTKRNLTVLWDAPQSAGDQS